MDNEQTPKKSFWKSKKFLYGVGIFFAIGFVVNLADKNNPPPVQQVTETKTATEPVQAVAKPTTSKVSVGEEGYVNVPSPKAIIATTESNYKEITKIYIANDTMGIGDFLLSGKGFSVLNGTKVLVTDMSTGVRKVRILEGESIGKSGWIAYEWVSKTK